MAEAIGKENGQNAVAFRVAEQYLESFSKLAKSSTTLMLPANVTDPASMVAQVSAS